jgi:YD repeat-containing protein
MKQLFLFFLLVCAIAAQAQNPYAALGIEEQVLHYDDTHKEVFDQDSTKPIGYALYNIKEGILAIFDLQDTLIAAQKIDPSKVARWLGVDPLAGKYPNDSPYNFVLNNPIRFIDPDGRETTTTYVDQDNRVLSVVNDGKTDVVRFNDLCQGTWKGTGADLAQKKGGEYIGKTIYL